MEQTKWMTPEDVAQRWGISAAKVRQYLREGHIAGFKIGTKLWRISTDEVLRFEQENTHAVVPASVQSGPVSWIT